MIVRALFPMLFPDQPCRGCDRPTSQSEAHEHWEPKNDGWDCPKCS